VKQYLVHIYRGYFESCSIAVIPFFVVIDEDDVDYNPTEVAILFKEAFDDYCSKENKEAARYEHYQNPQRDKEWYFNYLFNTDIDGIGFGSEAFEEKGFLMRIPANCKLTKIISLTLMDNYLTTQDHWYFNNLHNNQVSSEVFYETILKG
jgi:hypothetical protein